MSIALDEKTVGIWFIQLTPTSDWLCTVRRGNEGESEVIYRFRYYNSPDPWDEHDKKNWYSAKTTDPEAKVIDVTREIANRMAAVSGGEKWELLRGSGTMEQFMEQFQKLPFVHCKEAKPS